MKPINASLMRAEFYLMALFAISSIAFALPLFATLIGLPLLVEVSVFGLLGAAGATMILAVAQPFLY